MTTETKEQPPTIPPISISTAWRYNRHADRNSGGLPSDIGPDGIANSESGGYTPAGYCTPENGDWIPAIRISGVILNLAEMGAVSEYIEYWREIDDTIAGDGEIIIEESDSPIEFHITFRQDSPLYDTIVAKQK